MIVFIVYIIIFFSNNYFRNKQFGYRLCLILSGPDLCLNCLQRFSADKDLVFSPPMKYFTDRSKAVRLLWIFYVYFCLVFAMPLCASVYMCLVVTCWERAGLLVLVCGV